MQNLLVIYFKQVSTYNVIKYTIFIYAVKNINCLKIRHNNNSNNIIYTIRDCLIFLSTHFFFIISNSIFYVVFTNPRKKFQNSNKILFYCSRDPLLLKNQGNTML